MYIPQVLLISQALNCEQRQKTKVAIYHYHRTELLKIQAFQLKMSDNRNVPDDISQEASTNNDGAQSDQSSPQNEQLPEGSVNDDNLEGEDIHRPNSTELQRRRTEALERILLASDSNLSLPQPSDSANL
ncbi:hypothetical protein Ocin01_11309 [Orchesella cincta]|uniref:Uncharacterized protein n=1 Tax=Orchesella cincta TaxID=48709 RepID=A0A1D2MR47_ORCCI|nr:hypothetical protein Ocin01_11309 [Orchesella cincta]